MTTELELLVWVAAATAAMWVPYIAARMVVAGVPATLGNPSPDMPALPAWAERARRAHANAVENLVVFAAVILAAHAAGVSTDTTVLAAKIYLGARIAHYLVFTAGIPVVRTLAFLVGFGCQVAIAAALLA